MCFCCEMTDLCVDLQKNCSSSVANTSDLKLVVDNRISATYALVEAFLLEP